MELYSNAFNFESYTNGGVDLRTGQYSSTIRLGSIAPEGAPETYREIRISFSMMHRGDVGYGQGWILHLTEFNANTQQLRMITGETYTCRPLPPVGSSAPLEFVDRKLRDMVVRRVSADILHVIHKDGVVEVLRRLRPGFIFSLDVMIFENGERFNFSYEWIASGDRLSRVVNAQTGRVRMRLLYNNQLLSQVQVLRERERIAYEHFWYFNQRLRKVSVPVEENIAHDSQASFEFGYQDVMGYLAISSFKNPMGGEDIVQYNPRGHVVRNEHIPFVTQLISWIGNDSPEVLHTYTYSQTNFTGWPFQLFNPDLDNMHQHLVDYEYWCRDATLNSARAVLQEQTVTFNRFHLEISNIISRSSARLEKVYAYNIRPGEPFGAQPANLYLPRSIRTSYVALARREELTTIETDDFGNETLRIEPSGIRNELSYFPIEGFPGKCPAEPHGLFQRFISQERIVPSVAGPNPKITHYTYTQLPGLAGWHPYIVLEASVFADNLKISLAYSNMPGNSVLHGRISSQEMTVNNLSTREQFLHELNGDVLTETRNVIGFDSSVLTSMRSTSVVNHKVLSIQKENAVTIQIAYDINGRVTSETISPGTVHQAVRRYSYQFVSAGSPANMIMTDSVNGEYIIRYNGLGRTVSVAQRRQGSEQQIHVNAYNQLNQLISETEIDRIAGQTVTMVTRYHYDRWGQVVETIRPDNSVVVSHYDPIWRERLQGIEGSGMVRIVENEFSKAMSEQQVAINGQVVTTATRTFDGFGRCISETDINGNRSNFTYDIFDRITVETVTPRNGQQARTIRSEYPTHMIESLKTAISVNHSSLGRRIYDGVGRLVEQVRSSNRTSTRFFYPSRATRPSRITLPSGIVRDYQYNQQIDAVTQINVVSQGASTFQHDNGGRLHIATNQESIRTLHHDEYGRLMRDVLDVQNLERNNARDYTYSPAGRLVNVQSSRGENEVRIYDHAGRVSEVRISGTPIGISQLSVSYDNSGRINTLNAGVDGQRFSSEIAYDAFGREMVRRLSRNGVVFQIITLLYHQNNNLASRQITDASGAMVVAENFSYDTYGRLETYSCSGPEYAVDQRGRSVQSQRFSYDHLNNVTEVVTTMVDRTIDTVTRVYDTADPTQLRRIISTNPVQVIDLGYDADGNLRNEGLRLFQFDGMERLVSITNNGIAVTSYGYDASGRQIRQSSPQAAVVGFEYIQERLRGISQGAAYARWLRSEETVLARSISAIGTESYGADAAASVRIVNAPNNSVRHVHYLPYGTSNIDGAAAGTLLERHRPGFNGECYDPLGRLYHLGNGVRAYSPELMIFLSPDPQSPFESGGINGYAYCGGDPVNFKDPSGRFSMPMWAGWVLLGLSIIATAVSLGFAIPALAGSIALGTISVGLATAAITSMTTGVISLGLSIASTSIAQIDAVNGSDNGRTAYWLSVAAFGTGLISFSSGLVSPGVSSANVVKTLKNPGRSIRYVANTDGSFSPYVASRIKVWRVAGKEFLNALTSYQIGERGRVAWAANFLSDSLSIGDSIWGVVNGVQSSIVDYPYYPSKDEKTLFSSEAGVPNGIHEQRYEFYDEFDMQAARLRASGILDFYSS